MGLEIERKFIADSHFNYAEIAESRVEISQAYLSTNPDVTVRVRTYNTNAFLTVKSRNEGSMRQEWEYEIDYQEAKEMMGLPGLPIISKIRYVIPYMGHFWEVDVFQGKLDGLILAEIELSAIDEKFEMPPFIEREVTEDPAYFNSNLSERASNNTTFST